MNKKLYDYSIFLLSKRDYSEYKMRTKLKEKEATSEEADEIITRLLELNYLREEEYKRAKIRGMLHKGYDNKYIINKLQAEYVQCDNEDIEELKLDLNLTTDEQIEYLIHKKLRNKTIPEDRSDLIKLKNKVKNFLFSKGYDFQIIETALAEYLKAHGQNGVK